MATQPAAQKAPMPMPKMTAYTIQSSTFANNPPSVCVDVGPNKTFLVPANKQDNSYWFVVMTANNPRVKLKEWLLPGTSNSTVPPGIDTFMNDPNNLFFIGTQSLSTLNMPQGPLYNFLAQYGAGRELAKLEQVAHVYGCGSFGHMCYVLTGQGGKRVPGQPAPISYELGSYTSTQAMLLMSLMPQMNGAPPYTICDTPTFTSP
jgi:hypothetical protein